MNDSLQPTSATSAATSIRMNYSPIGEAGTRVNRWPNHPFPSSGRSVCRFCKCVKGSGSLPSSPSSPSPSSSFSSLGDLPRCTSDPVFLKNGRRRKLVTTLGCSCSRGSKGLPTASSSPLNSSFQRFSYSKTQTTVKKSACLSPVQIAQRSNSKTVKRTIAALEEKCRHFEENRDLDAPTQTCGARSASMPVLGLHKQFHQSASHNTVLQPEMECSMIADWSSDSYYRVVITKCRGISTLCRALEVFPNNVQIQESCCTALGFLLPAQVDNVSITIKVEGDDDHGTKLAIDLMTRARENLPSSKSIGEAVDAILQHQDKRRNLMSTRDDRQKSFGPVSESLERMLVESSPFNCNSMPENIDHRLHSGMLDCQPIGDFKLLAPLPASTRSLTVPMSHDSRRSRVSWSYPIRPAIDPFGGDDCFKTRTLPSDDLIMPLLEQKVKNLFTSLPDPGTTSSTTSSIQKDIMTKLASVGRVEENRKASQLLEVLHLPLDLAEPTLAK